MVYRPHKFRFNALENCGISFRPHDFVYKASGRHNELKRSVFLIFLKRCRVVVETIHESQCL